MRRKSKWRRKRRAKTTPVQLPNDLTAAIEQKALEDLFRRQSKGKKLTGADYAFIKSCKKPAPDSGPSDNVIQMRPMTYYQKLSAIQDKALETLVALLDSGKPTSQALAAKMLLDKGRQEAPPKADITTVEFNPLGEKESDGDD